MTKKAFLLNIAFVWGFISFCSAGGEGKGRETRFQIFTTEGVIKIKLYNETPLHRDNFIKLVKDHYYDSTLFHRVINEFMIQGGDPDSRRAKPGDQLGNGGPDYTIPAEFLPDKLYHKKGALAAARNGDDVNPAKASSGSQFYLVQGKKFTDAELTIMEQRMLNMKKQELFMEIINKPENINTKMKFITFRQQQQTDSLIALQKFLDPQVQAEILKNPPFHFTEEQRKSYSTIGGVPHLDGNYTVFGEITDGMDVLDRIAAAKTLPGDRPEKDIRILKITIEN
jgi:cyclophilin family peptidyl-prolyl cis-trans isomerase